MVFVKISLSALLLIISILPAGSRNFSFNKLYPILNEYVRDFPSEFRKIPEDRRYRLNEIVYYLEDQERNNISGKLLFISTNQSSVGQMAQVWSKTAAYYFGFTDYQAYSGGIKPDEISLNTIISLEKAGYIVYKMNIDGVDVYRIKYSYNLDPLVVYPKKIEHVKNPNSNFMAIFVDRNADLNISNLRGTYHRLLLGYEDPVGYDGSEMEEQIYNESCKQVAIEMFYVFSQLRKKLKDTP